MRRAGAAAALTIALTAALGAATSGADTPGCLEGSSAQGAHQDNFLTSGQQCWNVPADVVSATIDVYGANGGASDTGSVLGGKGAHVSATIAVTPGMTLQINVGGRGAGGTAAVNEAGGFNGGGGSAKVFGDTGSGGGGGASDVRSGSFAPSDRILVAGGGGGAGGDGSTSCAMATRGTGGAGGSSNLSGSQGSNGGATGTGGLPGNANGTGGGIPGSPALTDGGNAGGTPPGSDLSLGGVPGSNTNGGGPFGGDGGGGGGGYTGGGGGAAGVSSAGDCGGGGGGAGGANFIASGASNTGVVNVGNILPTSGAHIAGDGEVTIQYAAQPAPAATTGVASVITPTTATVAGTVTTRQLSATAVFEYGTTLQYGSVSGAAQLTGATGDTSVTAPLAGLTPSTVYHFRIDATTGAGTADGADHTFTTPAAPPKPTTPTPPPAPPVAPKARISAGVESGTLTRITLDGRGSHATGARIIGYRWTQGSRVLSRQPRFATRVKKPTTVALTVTDSNGQTSTTKLLVRPAKRLTLTLRSAFCAGCTTLSTGAKRTLKRLRAEAEGAASATVTAYGGGALTHGSRTTLGALAKAAASALTSGLSPRPKVAVGGHAASGVRKRAVVIVLLGRR